MRRQRSPRWWVPPAALLASGVAVAVARDDLRGIGLSLFVAAALFALTMLLKPILPQSWFTSDEQLATEVFERWKRYPVIGHVLRLGSWCNKKLWGLPPNWPIGAKSSSARGPTSEQDKSPEGGARTD